MSRIHRAVEKADREGLLTRTQAPEPPPPAWPAAEEPTRLSLANPAPALGPFDAVPGSDDAVPDSELDPLIVVAVEPASIAAEQYRMLRTHLSARDRVRRLQVVLVTSPRNGDGKTLTAANLAVSMAQEFQQRVLLLEADLRRPTVSTLFDLPASPGLAGVLIGSAMLESALVPVPGQHLTVLPAGDPPARPTELIGSTAMRRAIEALRSQFDRIVVDTPPVALADTHLLGSFADGILMVVRAGITPRDAVERALAAFDREKVLGLVLNEVEGTADAYAYEYAEAPVLTAD
jgi:capsular exopolysaccharide synthesis family protein